MLNIVSIIVGLFAALLMLPGLVPLFGWMNWIMLPIAGVGLILGLLSHSNGGRNFNIVIIAIGVARLWIGGGIF